MVTWRNSWLWHKGMASADAPASESLWDGATATEADFNEWLGKRVVLHGLSARPELNGSTGRVMSWDEHVGRAGVRLDGKNKPMAIKTANLRLDDAGVVDIVSDFASCCAIEHKEEVRDRVVAARDGRRHEDSGSDKVVLDLECTDLSQVPDSVGKLVQVEELWLSVNGLKSLPLAIGNLTSLRLLDLDDNKLSTLPEAVGALTGLRSLYANSNLLETLPATLGKLRGLRELRVSKNRLHLPAAVPESLCELKGCLKQLWLAHNQLEEVPSCVCQLHALEEMDLQGNAPLTALPVAIGSLQRLRVLELADNPALVWPPPDVVKQGAEAVQLWLRRDSQPPSQSQSRPASAENMNTTGGGAGGGGVAYAIEAPGSVHTPLAPDAGGEDGETESGGGEFIFPAAPR